LETSERTSALNLQHKIRCRMGELSLLGKPDMHYLVDRFIDVIPHPTAVR
jgi:hypothetical protein